MTRMRLPFMFSSGLIDDAHPALRLQLGAMESIFRHVTPGMAVLQPGFQRERDVGGLEKGTHLFADVWISR